MNMKITLATYIDIRAYTYVNNVNKNCYKTYYLYIINTFLVHKMLYNLIVHVIFYLVIIFYIRQRKLLMQVFNILLNNNIPKRN